MPASRSMTGRRRPALLLAAAAALVTWAVVLLPIIVSPHADTASPAHPVDVVLALGGDPRVALDGYALAASGVAPVVLVSDPYHGDQHAVTRLCQDPAPRVKVVCFVPDPSTTRGEAQELGRLAATYHWTSAVVLAPRFHVARSRFVMRRCFSGSLSVVAANESYPLWQWGYQLAYQSVAWVKATVFQSGC